MAFYRNTFDGGTNGVELTSLNTGGISGDPFDIIVTEDPTSVNFATAAANKGAMGVRVTPSPSTLLKGYFGWTFIGGLKTKSSIRFYVRFASYPLSGSVFCLWSNTADTGSRASLRITQTGIVSVLNNASAPVWTSTLPMSLNTWYRIEAALDQPNNAMTYRTYTGDSIVSIPELSSNIVGASFGGTLGTAHIFLGWRIIVAGGGIVDYDDFAADDATLDLLGPTGKAEIPITVTYLGSNQVRVAWTHPTDAPSGVTVARCPGIQSADGNGRPVHHPMYDPMTIPGTTQLASNLTASPYTNTGVPLGSFTYWVVRSA